MEENKFYLLLAGFCLSFVVAFIKAFDWLFGIKKENEKQNLEMAAIEKRVCDIEKSLQIINQISERMARIETKVDLLIQDKIK